MGGLIFKEKDVKIMIKYNIDKEKGIVEAFLENCENDALNHVNRRLRAKGFGPVAGEKLKMKDTFHAKAKCHPEDVFDEAVGMELAKSRVLDKYHENRIMVLNQFDEMADAMQMIVETNIQKSLHNHHN